MIDKQTLRAQMRAARVAFVEGYTDEYSQPLPFKGGVRGGGSLTETGAAGQPHPNPSPEGEGLKVGRPTIHVPQAFLDRLEHGLTVASYVPMHGEADPSPLARAAVEAGCEIVLPHVTGPKPPLRFLAWDTEAALIAGPFGLHQPAHSADERAPDIILTPLVAFDHTLNRLGQGAGHYDRAFAAFPNAWRVGVAWSIQQVDALPADPWDVPLHAIATETDWITP